MIIGGFDPGGSGRFGWCVAEASERGSLIVRKAGVASTATQARDRALRQLAEGEKLIAAGIDSPLYWPITGGRKVDEHLRQELTRLGAQNTSGTVQHVNSLRGACLAQGVMLATSLRQANPDIRITETHPKALLWLLKVASRARAVRDVVHHHLADWVESVAENLSEHERDAVVGAIAAAAMMQETQGWRDLAVEAGEVFRPVDRVEYWLPI